MLQGYLFRDGAPPSASATYIIDRRPTDGLRRSNFQHFVVVVGTS
jgi:hypothetical protein